VSRSYPCHRLDPDAGTVKIGDRTLLACNVSVITATHPVSPEERRGSLGKEYAKPVTIGDDCWIGANVVILPGVTIGNGVTVGAGSVVTKDVEDRSIVVGELSLLDSMVRALSDISFRQSGTTSEEGIGYMQIINWLGSHDVPVAGSCESLLSSSQSTTAPPEYNTACSA
jgi:carbonic anhydrase/acetyltransferase-like protein (isoleucine patch superfamily)